MTTIGRRTAEDDLEVVRRQYGALGSGDVAALLADCAADVVVRQSALLPWGGEHRGHAGFLAFLGGVRAHLDSRVEVGALYRAGDRVVQIGRTRGTARTTGRSFDAHEVHVWRVQDGLVAEFDAWVDTDELLRALAPATP